MPCARPPALWVTFLTLSHTLHPPAIWHMVLEPDSTTVSSLRLLNTMLYLHFILLVSPLMRHFLLPWLRYWKWFKWDRTSSFILFYVFMALSIYVIHLMQHVWALDVVLCIVVSALICFAPWSINTWHDLRQNTQRPLRCWNTLHWKLEECP